VNAELVRKLLKTSDLKADYFAGPKAGCSDDFQASWFDRWPGARTACRIDASRSRGLQRIDGEYSLGGGGCAMLSCTLAGVAGCKSIE